VTETPASPNRRPRALIGLLVGLGAATLLAAGGLALWQWRAAHQGAASPAVDKQAEALRQALALGDERARHLCTVDGWCVTVTELLGGTLNAVDASSEQDIWAVGDGGIVLHCNGRDWGGWLGLARSASLDAVRAFGPRDVWVAGSGDSVLHWDGLTWTTEALPKLTQEQEAMFATKSLLVGTSGEDLWLKRQTRTLLRRQAGRWSEVPEPFSSSPSSLVMAAPGEPWAAGSGAARWTTHGWQPFEGPEGSKLAGLGWPQSAARLGDGSLAFMYWNAPIQILKGGVLLGTVPLPPVKSPRSLAGSSSRDLWVLGDTRGELKHWDGSSWRHEDSSRVLMGVASVGDGKAIAVGAVAERRLYLPTLQLARVENANYWLALALGGEGSGTPRELWLGGAGNKLRRWTGGAWQEVEITADKRGSLRSIVVTAKGSVALLTTKGEVLSRHAPQEPFTPLLAPPKGDWVAMAADAEGRLLLLSDKGEVVRWAVGLGSEQWQSLREADSADSLRFEALAVAPTGALLLQGEEWALGNWRQFLGELPLQLAKRTVPTQQALDTCSSPRQQLVRSVTGTLLASSGTQQRPCLLQWLEGSWNPLPLTGPESNLAQGGPSPLEELVIVHGGDRRAKGHLAHLAARRANGWHLYPAPLPELEQAVVEPKSQRAWVLGSVASVNSVLDFSLDEPWRFVPPTLVLDEAEGPLRRATTQATPAPAVAARSAGVP
jgi:hypothetical protein